MLVGTSAGYEVELKRRHNGDSVYESDGAEQDEKDETGDDGEDENENDEGENFDDEGEDDRCFKDI